MTITNLRVGICNECGTKENLVYSGVDAFVLGVQTETVCYPCANGGYEYWQEAL